MKNYILSFEVISVFLRCLLYGSCNQQKIWSVTFYVTSKIFCWLILAPNVQTRTKLHVLHLKEVIENNLITKYVMLGWEFPDTYLVLLVLKKILEIIVNLSLNLKLNDYLDARPNLSVLYSLREACVLCEICVGFPVDLENLE